MTDRRIDGFFYGLFMGSDILAQSQVTPNNPRRAYVDGFALRIGRRATLWPSSGARAYGVVYALTHDELDRLYTAPGLEAYRPEAVLAHCMAGERLVALCFNLPEPPAPNEANEDYAARLRAILRELNFPADYVDSI